VFPSYGQAGERYLCALLNNTRCHDALYNWAKALHSLALLSIADDAVLPSFPYHRFPIISVCRVCVCGVSRAVLCLSPNLPSLLSFFASTRNSRRPATCWIATSISSTTWSSDVRPTLPPTL
jgi:hypothetical protein